MRHTTTLTKKPRGPWLEPLWLARCDTCLWRALGYYVEAKRYARSHELSTQADEVIGDIELDIEAAK